MHLTRRERVMRSLCFEEVDQVPRDLGGMASTGISAFLYPKLVEALGLPARPPRLHDTHQMLALPDVDVLDALDCDVVTVFWGVTNAFEEPRKWRRYDFNGRLQARVRSPRSFATLPDGTIEQPKWHVRMGPSAYVFNADHAGQNVEDVDYDRLPLKDLKRLKRDLAKRSPKPDEIDKITELCRRVRESTDRAVFFNGPGQAEIAISAHGGMGVFPVICMVHPDYVAEYHDIMTDHTVAKLEAVLPKIARYVDIMITGGDDWGTQQATIASPDVFRELFVPYYRKVNDAAHGLAPGLKTFLHSCGAIYDILDDIVECGFDILNPVQWTAGGHSYREWKDKCRRRISLWGGGIDTQNVLPRGSLQDVERQVAETVSCLAQHGGYVFNGIHNLLATVDPLKVIAAYRAAAEVSVSGTPRQPVN
jgi:uroporphyrinogen decarboxylase